ncbi:hypothetical protein F2P56_032920 [Juglans regia]|uniref:RNase H type-1 domain-containing protein n=2 Tax=Juglans regia TaxID=51240 RepID=A0A833TVK2_JUGRE|nr:uncharacterized protein LOC109014035 [Juglans regia]KAF5447364.1 hypothetical protein F2P56_032920 [Juglans regia]
MLLGPPKGTRFWCMIAKNIPIVLNYTKWKIKDGNVFFWYDKWLAQESFAEALPVVEQPLLKIKDCKLENGWDVDLLERLVGTELAENVINVLARSKEGEDLLIWTKTESGNFTTKSAWDCIRVRSPILEGHKWIWNSILPKKFSVFMWKVWHGALIVDDKIRWIGIPLASKCSCCKQGKYEDINHVLFEGEVAGGIWKKCGALLGLPVGRLWRETCLSWFRRASNSSQIGVILGLLPIIISWRLWGRRCSARMENKVETSQVVWLSIKHWVSVLGQGLAKFKKFNQNDSYILWSLNVFPIPIQQHPIQLISWSKPLHGRVKLNTDGSCLGYGDSTQAELRALLEGIKRCKQLNLSAIDIDLDSKVVLSWLPKNRCGIWYLEDYWEEIQELIKNMDYKYSHIFREGNVVVDWLARWGARVGDAKWRNTLDSPAMLRGLIRIDKWGLASIRCKSHDARI